MLIAISVSCVCQRALFLNCFYTCSFLFLHYLKHSNSWPGTSSFVIFDWMRINVVQATSIGCNTHVCIVHPEKKNGSYCSMGHSQHTHTVCLVISHVFMTCYKTLPVLSSQCHIELILSLYNIILPHFVIVVYWLIQCTRSDHTSLLSLHHLIILCWSNRKLLFSCRSFLFCFFVFIVVPICLLIKYNVIRFVLSYDPYSM